MICTFILGIILGCVAKHFQYRTDGKLLIDTNNPKKDIYRLDLGKNLENLSKKKKITLTVDSKANLSD